MDIVFDIERCFVDGRSGPIELGVTRLDELAQAHAPTWDNRDLGTSSGSPYIAYVGGGGRLNLFDTWRTGQVTTVAVDLRGDHLLRMRLEDPERNQIELHCGPFLVHMHDKPAEHWSTLVDALASGAIEPTRPIELSSNPRSDLRIINLDWRFRNGRRLHLAFEPRLITTPSTHACQVRFEYCIQRVRLFAAPIHPA